MGCNGGRVNAASPPVSWGRGCLHLKKAVIAHHGELAPNFRYLQEYLG